MRGAFTISEIQKIWHSGKTEGHPGKTGTRGRKPHGAANGQVHRHNDSIRRKGRNFSKAVEKTCTSPLALSGARSPGHRQPRSSEPISSNPGE